MFNPYRIFTPKEYDYYVFLTIKRFFYHKYQHFTDAATWKKKKKIINVTRINSFQISSYDETSIFRGVYPGRDILRLRSPRDWNRCAIFWSRARSSAGVPFRQRRISWRVIGLPFTQPNSQPSSKAPSISGHRGMEEERQRYIPAAFSRPVLSKCTLFEDPAHPRTLMPLTVVYDYQFSLANVSCLSFVARRLMANRAVMENRRLSRRFGLIWRWCTKTCRRAERDLPSLHVSPLRSSSYAAALPRDLFPKIKNYFIISALINFFWRSKARENNFILCCSEVFLHN